MRRKWLATCAVLLACFFGVAFMPAGAQAHTVGLSGVSQRGSLAGLLASGASAARPGRATTTVPAGPLRTVSSAGAKKPSDKLNLTPYSLPTATGPVSFDTGSLLTLGAKFAIVLVLLLVCLRVLKYVMPGGRQAGLGKSNHMVLHTEALGDKHRVCLLDLGDSIVVVGVSASGMHPISTIGGADDVDRLRRRYAPARPVCVTRDSVAGSEQRSFSAALSEAETLEARSPAIPESDAPAVHAANPRVQTRPASRLHDVLRQRFAPAPAADLELGRAVGRLREMRQRIDRA